MIYNALESILQQQEMVKEILIIDDASSDGFQDFLPLLAEKMQLPNVNIMRNEINLGYQKTWNKCILHSSQELVLILHQDDMLKSNALRDLYEFISENDKLALVGAYEDYFDESWRPVGSNKRSNENMIWERGKIFEFVVSQNSYISCSSVLMKKQIVIEEGLFNIEITGTDEELWPRILRNHPIAVLGESLVYRRIHRQQAENYYWLQKDNFDKFYKVFKKVVNYESRNWKKVLLYIYIKKKISYSSLSVASKVLNEYNIKEMSFWHIWIAFKYFPAVIITKKSFWQILLKNFIIKKVNA